MGTRAVYTFKSHGDAFHVYKHWDNSPENAAAFIAAATEKAWDLPRFEADEFAAAFIAANKDKGGDIRLIKSARQCGDAAYFYTVEPYFEDLERDNFLVVTCKDWEGKRLFKGGLRAFTQWAQAYAEAY